jgi:hypothetical protein
METVNDSDVSESKTGETILRLCYRIHDDVVFCHVLRDLS